MLLKYICLGRHLLHVTEFIFSVLGVFSSYSFFPSLLVGTPGNITPVGLYCRFLAKLVVYFPTLKAEFGYNDFEVFVIV